MTAKRINLARTLGTIKRLHVDRHAVRKDEPAITIQTSDGPIKARTVTIKGPSSVMHRPDDPLSCGARVWIETLAELEWKE